MRNSLIFKILLIVACFVVAGPELGLAIEFLVMLDVIGIELFLFALSLSVLSFGRTLIIAVQKFDSYFFISSRRDIADCPALLAHAIPFFIVGLFVVASSAVAKFFLGD